MGYLLTVSNDQGSTEKGAVNLAPEDLGSRPVHANSDLTSGKVHIF